MAAGMSDAARAYEAARVYEAARAYEAVGESAPACPPGTIFNPRTKRCVSVSGTVGRAILEKLPVKNRLEYMRRTAPPPEPPRPPPQWVNPTVRAVGMEKLVFSPGSNSVVAIPHVTPINSYDDVPGVRNGTDVGVLKDDVDLEWMAAQVAYLKRLPVDDFMTAAALTLRSMAWINPFLKTGHIPKPPVLLKNLARKYWQSARGDGASLMDHMCMPLYPQLRKLGEAQREAIRRRGYMDIAYDGGTELAFEVFIDPTRSVYDRYACFEHLLPHGAFSDRALETALRMCANDMDRIVRNSPRHAKTMVLYRGTPGKSVRDSDKVYELTTFTSTSFAPSWPMKRYAEKPDAKLLKMKLRPAKAGEQTALFLSPLNLWDDHGELEINLRPGVRFAIGPEDTKLVRYVDWWEGQGTIMKDKRVTTLVSI